MSALLLLAAGAALGLAGPSALRFLRRNGRHPVDAALEGEIKAFSDRLFDSCRVDAFPRSLAQIGERLLEALHPLAGEVELRWIFRENGEDVCGVQRAGPAESSRGPAPEVDAKAFVRAWEAGQKDARKDGARRLSWGRAKGPACVLEARDPDPAGAGLAKLAPFLDAAKPIISFMGELSFRLKGMDSACRELETGVATLLRDLTATQDRLVEKAREVRTLKEVAATLNVHTTQAQSTLGAIISILAKSLRADLAAFLLLDEATAELVTQPGAYGLEGEHRFYRIPLAEDSASSVKAFKSGEALLAGDAQNDSRVITRYAKLWEIRSLMVLPLKVDGRTLGVLRVGSREKDYFSQAHMDLAQAIAREAAVIVEAAMVNRRLAETMEQLTALNRMKDDFVSTVSHEFKTPLTTIMGFLTVVLEGETGAVTQEQQRFLGLSLGAARRLADLVTDLLDISKLEGGVTMDIQSRRLEPVLQASFDAQLPQASKLGKILKLSMADPLPPVLCDARWIGVVMDNLISNGLKYTGTAGTVEVMAADKGEFVLIQVVDDGIGIPPQEKDKMFEKFYRATNRPAASPPGTGLGLAICREVLSKHGGKIWFESELGKGSRFFIVLKAAPLKDLGSGASSPRARSAVPREKA